MESKSSIVPRKEPREPCARDRATRRASMMLMAASSGDYHQLWPRDVLPAPPPQQVAIEVVAASRNAAAAAALDDDMVVTEPETGSTALHVVAAAGDGRCYLESARVICGKAWHLLGAPNSDGDTPLHCAARAGNSRMVARLLELAAAAGGEGEGEARARARALVRARNKRGETALHEAVRFCGHDHEMVRALMREDRWLASVVANDGTSPMYLACSLGRKTIARELHQRGHGISYSGPDGQNALHAAVIHDKGITMWLLEWNKDLVNQRDINGSTPMHFAASAPDPSFQFTSFVFTTSNLETHFVGSYLLPQRCLTKFYEWRKLPFPLLLEAEPSLAFQPDIHGSYPVHIAASAESMVAVIVLLTKYPGCAGLRDAMGRTFLHVAVEKKRYHVVKFVCHCSRSFRPMLNVQDKDGNTALHLAVKQVELDIFRCLMRNRNVKINLQNNQGNTPMDLALGKVRSGFYFGLTAPRRILGMLNLANAQTSSGNRRRDQMVEYNPSLNEGEESSKIKDFAQIVGIGSVLVATATFAAAITIPGGVRSPGDVSPAKPGMAAPPPAGTPVFTGKYAFDGFVVSNTLAFICSTLATFSLVYCGVAAVDIQRRFKLVSFSLAFLLCAARSFCAAFAFSLYLLLAPVEHGTAIAACVMTSLALLDGLWFLITSFHDTTVLLSRRTRLTFLKVGIGFIANTIYLFWPYLVIFGYMFIDDAKDLGDF
ncbi:unnamed protein product [Urochloa decumbens]|uniref:PGG domain-containing protein n=1 Tax=Urochloa decumbens TaxID=240449 RepID=A0ABC8VR09_9POAL